MTNEEDPESGYALIAVTMFGGIASLVFLILVQSAVSERRAVSDSLAQTRAYWAAIGEANYLLSRTRTAPVTKNNGNTKNVLPISCGYLNEIADASGSGSGCSGGAYQSVMTWFYPDVSANYAIKVSAVMTPLGSNQGSEIDVKFSFSTSAVSPEALRTIPITRLVDFGYCMLNSQTSKCNSYSPDKNNAPFTVISYVHRTTS